MRIRRLDLVRYGKFTDRSVDFGPKPAGGPDLHVVFGLNEAGKSTALNAYLDLLYGIEERSRYAFLHDYSSMRVGGVLELDGNTGEYARVKQRTNSLLDSTGKPIMEAALGGYLSGLSRSDYGSMFSLDDDTLEAGGKAILDSHGDLGQLLFAGGAGVPHAADVLTGMRAEADRIHRKHAQHTELARLKKQLAELKAEKDAIDTLASTFEALEAERADASTRYDRMLSDRVALSCRLDAIAKYDRAIPKLAELQRLGSRLAGMPSTRVPVTTWEGTIADLIIADATVGTRMVATANEILRLERKLDDMNVDEALLANAERVRRLREMKARHDATDAELKSLRAELATKEGAIGAILGELGRPDEAEPSKLLLPVAATTTLRMLIEQRSMIDAEIRATRKEEIAAKNAVEAAQERVPSTPVPPTVRARIAAALGKSRENGQARRLLDAQETLDECMTRWNAWRARLHPWDCDPLDLAKMAVPLPGQLLAWNNELAHCRNQLAALRARVDDLENVRISLCNDRDALRGSHDLPEDAEAVAARQVRGAAWERHRQRMVEETAEAFEAALAVDDGICTRRLEKAAVLQQFQTTMTRLEGTRIAMKRAESEIALMEERLVLLGTVIRKATSDIVGERAPANTPEMELEALNDVLASRTSAMEAWQQLEVARQRLIRIMEIRNAVFDELRSASKLAGVVLEPGDSDEALFAVVEEFLEQQRELQTRSREVGNAIDGLKQEFAARQLARAIAEQQHLEWQENLNLALAGTWLDAGTPAPILAGIVDRLGHLSDSLRQRGGLRSRMDTILAEGRAFFQEMTSVAAEVGQSVDRDNLGRTALLLFERAEEAERSNLIRIALTSEIDRLQALRIEQERELERHESNKMAALRAYEVDTLPKVIESQEALKERDRLRSTISDIEAEVISELGVVDVDAARAMLDGTSAETLAKETADIQQRLVHIEEELAQQLIRRTRAADRLETIGSDAAVARLDARRRTVMLEIEENAKQYLRLTIGALAASRALQEYRERHRTGMMQRASEAFATMTGGAYSGLSSQPIKGGEVLIATMPGGGSKIADALSKGTRFQLYLSLRLAGYKEFAALRSPVPFIADDIMETFDHVRSAAVFRLFGQIGQLGQVIYFTHHRHLCEIAKSMVPTVSIHDIS